MKNGAAQIFNSPDGTRDFGITMQNGGIAYFWAADKFLVDGPLEINGNLDATNHKLKEIADGTDSTDAASYGQLTTTNSDVALNTTALNGYSMPTTAATSGQVLGINNIVAKTTQWVTGGGGGGITETNTAVTCEFNAGGTSGTTDFTATFLFKKIGNMVYVEVPEIGVVIPSAAIFKTELSASPACVPVDLRPINTGYGFITTNSNTVVPLGAAGSFEIKEDGNIEIFYQNAGTGCAGCFPSGVWGGTGFHQNPTTANYIQQVIYSLSQGTQTHTVSGTGSSGSVTPTPQYFTAGVTSSLTFALTGTSGRSLISATDDCDAGSPGGSIVGSDYVVTTVTQNCTINAVFAYIYNITTAATTNGTISPTSDTWTAGITPSLTFALTPDSGYSIDNVTDTCDGGTSGGAVVGSNYDLFATNQDCVITATFSTTTYTVDPYAIGGISLSPGSQNWTPGVTTSLTWSTNRSLGYQLSDITDDCDGGLPGGSLIGTDYTVTTVTQNCTVSSNGDPYYKASYVDIYALGALAVIPTGAYAVPNMILFGFGDITATTMATTQRNAILTATANESVGTLNFLSLGGALTHYSDFISTGLSTVISNIVSTINDINIDSTIPIQGVDLDLEGTGWTSAAIQTLADGFKLAGFYVSGAPQAYLSSGTNVDSTTPTNLIMTAGGGTGDTYGPVLATGGFDFVFVQTYNAGGWTVDSVGEEDSTFFQKIAVAINNTVLDDCTGVSTLCIKRYTHIILGQVANAGAGGQGPGAPTIFNPTAAQIYPYPGNSIPGYDQDAILDLFTASVTAGLDSAPHIGGVGDWSMTNDFGFSAGVSLYQPTDSATVGNFSDKALLVSL